MYRYFMLLFALLECTVTDHSVYVFFYNIRFNLHLSYSLVSEHQVGHQDHSNSHHNN